jgi:hypothetical protein
MSSTGNDPKTIELKVPQENKEEFWKSAKSLDFKLPIPVVVMSMKPRCETRKNKEKPGVTQVETYTLIGTDIHIFIPTLIFSSNDRFS